MLVKEKKGKNGEVAYLFSNEDFAVVAFDKETLKRGLNAAVFTATILKIGKTISEKNLVSSISEKNIEYISA